MRQLWKIDNVMILYIYICKWDPSSQYQVWHNFYKRQLEYIIYIIIHSTQIAYFNLWINISWLQPFDGQMFFHNTSIESTWRLK